MIENLLVGHYLKILKGLGFTENTQKESGKIWIALSNEYAFTIFVEK